MTPHLYLSLAKVIYDGDDINITMMNFNDRLTVLNSLMADAIDKDINGSGYDSINKIDELISQFKDEYKVELEAEEVGEI